MVNAVKKDKNKTIAKRISTPLTLEDLKEQLNKLDPKPLLAGDTGIEDLGVHYVVNEDKPKSFFSKVKTFLKGKKQ